MGRTSWKFEEGASYRLENFPVREWGGAKYLSMDKDSKIVSIDDIAYDVKLELSLQVKMLGDVQSGCYKGLIFVLLISVLS